MKKFFRMLGNIGLLSFLWVFLFSIFHGLPVPMNAFQTVVHYLILIIAAIRILVLIPEEYK